MNAVADTSAKDVLYKTENMYGGGIHRIGMHLAFRTVKSITYLKKRTYSLEFVGMHHPKEHPLESFRHGRSYEYGKLNAVMINRAGIGRQKSLANKAALKNISINFNYHIGANMEILKPVYLRIFLTDKNGVDILDEENNPIVNDMKYDANEHDHFNIKGKASSLLGMNELKFTPGLYSKIGLNFDFASYFDRVLAIEVGMTADIFLKGLPIMALNPKSNFMLSYYITVFVGKKYY